MKRSTGIRAAPVLAMLLLSLSGVARADEILLIIAHPDVPVTTLSRPEINRIFLLKTRAWEDGSLIIPVNREAVSEERIRFSNDVVGRSLRSLSNYWNQMQYRGYMPPVIQESDASMIAFVRNVPGAIGYVYTDKIPPGIKILARFK